MVLDLTLIVAPVDTFLSKMTRSFSIVRLLVFASDIMAFGAVTQYSCDLGFVPNLLNLGFEPTP